LYILLLLKFDQLLTLPLSSFLRRGDHVALNVTVARVSVRLSPTRGED
jgi:hypothetical protein